MPDRPTLEDLLTQLHGLKPVAFQDIMGTATVAATGEVETKWLGRKGLFADILNPLGLLPPEDRPKLGREVNVAKAEIKSEIEQRRVILAETELEAQLKSEAIDVTLPGRPIPLGRRHPLT